MSAPVNVGIYLFENMTMLDGYAPLQIFSLVKEFNCFTFGTTAKPTVCDSGVMLLPQYSLVDCPDLDVIVMPGGGNVLPPIEDQALMKFLTSQGPRARYVTSVCSGALILAEAGLLDGYRATTHWAWKKDFAEHYPEVEVLDERVVVDRNRITGGGITAGVDFALTVIAEILGVVPAQAIQLLVEYCPQPPFDAGSPISAPEEIVNAVGDQCAEVIAPLRNYLASKTKSSVKTNNC